VIATKRHKIGEAVPWSKTHPQWLRVRETDSQRQNIGPAQVHHHGLQLFSIGESRQTIRHKPEWARRTCSISAVIRITLSRCAFDEEPRRVTGALELDPDFGTDRLASGVMEFSSGHSGFSCGTQTKLFSNAWKYSGPPAASPSKFRSTRPNDRRNAYYDC